ncbi:condensation domain-containing protein, partial [Streptomyces sp. NPDC047070]|uniref:non-ribosomal peptide synthetase n=1 Tax=Streptomyces sp. NPDC047070 TaxID=3154923 RepID=UPI00345490CA
MIPLSFAQRRLWFIDRFEGPSATYNVPFVMRLSGELDVVALESAVRDVVTRHESLRTLVVEDAQGVAFQQVVPVAEATVDLPVTEVAPDRLDDTLAELAAAHLFDLSAEIPLRARLLRVGAHEHVLLLLVHHIAADGESMGPLARDLGAAYSARARGAAPGWADLPVQYVDYTMWQREVLGDESDAQSVLSGQVAHWRDELAGVPQPVRLPADRPRPPVASHRGSMVEFAVDGGLLGRVESLARDRDVTVPMVMQAALAVALQQFGAGEDIPIGSTIAGRTDDELVDLVGFFVNTWVLRADLSGRPSFVDVLERVQAKALAAYDNQDAPFERLVEMLNPERSTAYHPLFQVMFTWENDAWIDVDMPGLAARFEVLSTPTAKFDLEFNYFSDPAKPGLLCYLEYATDLFDAATAQRIADGYVRVIRALVEDPARPVAAVQTLDDAQRELVLRGFNDTDEPTPRVSVPELVARRVAEDPDAVAVECDGTTLTYRELDDRSDALASVLAAHGVGPGALVGLALPRTDSLPVALLAVLKAGGAYLPIDPRYPSGRLDFIVGDAAPVLLLTDRDTEHVLPAGDTPRLHLDSLDLTEPDEPHDPVQVALRPDDVAYVMYTSGSTGTPKGVAVTHGNVVNGVLRLATTMDVSAHTRMLAATSVNFDVSVFEVFTTLAAGGTVEIARDVLAVAERGGWQGGVVSTVPSVFSELLDQVAGKITADTVVFAGEALPAALVTRVREAIPGVRVVNAYGQTESFYATTFPIPAGEEWAGGGSAPIGAPLGNMRTYVLGSGLGPVPVGVVGELYVAG